MRIEPLTTHIGAELVGVDLAEAARNDDLFGAIREALLRHKVLFLRDQEIEPGRPCRLRPPLRRARGPSRRSAAIPSIPGWSGSTRTSTPRRTIIENAWHCDATWREGAADGRGASLHRRPGGRRRHDLGQHGARL